MTDAKSLYDEDFVAWAEQQAEALRSAGRGGTNQPLDWDNLAEEIDSLARSDRRALRNQIHRIVQHLAKLQFSPAADPRAGWRESIDDGRLQVELLLEDSPSLKAELDRVVAEQTPKAIKRAIGELAYHGEVDPTLERTIRATHYSAEQILEDWFFPAPARRSGSAE